jgi:hypothetical protein
MDEILTGDFFEDPWKFYSVFLEPLKAQIVMAKSNTIQKKTGKSPLKKPPPIKISNPNHRSTTKKSMSENKKIS